jgi:proteasome accessory factor B
MQPLERLVNLVALLLDAPRPLTFDEIRQRMAEAYEQEDQESAKRMFERDKGILRDIGVPIEVVPTDAWETDHGYTIPKGAYYLPEIRFTPEEISALFVAAHAGHRDPSAEEAVRKLLYGADGGLLAGAASFAVADVDAEARLTAVAEAVAEQRSIRFTYRTSKGVEAERQVDAYGLAVRGGRWYVVGRDHDRGEIRSFRLSRVVSDITDVGEGSEPPAGFRAADHVQVAPWGTGEVPERARIAFSPEVGWWATKGVPGADRSTTRADGWTEVDVPAGPGEGLVSWVLAFGPDAEVLEPIELRREVERRLEAILADL